MPKARKSAAARKRRPIAARPALARKRRAPRAKAAATHKRKGAARRAVATGKAAVATPGSKTGMLIRRPVEEVFNAFIDPEITTKFWFTNGTGKLEVGKQVHWEWAMYGFAIPVTAKVIEPNKRIVIAWPGHQSLTTVEWTFKPMDDGTTFVRISETGFAGAGDELTKRVASSTEGFSLVLAGLKALLEHNVTLNLVPDRFPKGIEE